ncbi:peptidyl-prolyl cis-trans isomerase [Pseudidiomarina gelatinasegens]|jgi:peptidyl-prolyl cis-trans isomerase A (cyclophilin A)|uniref:Peptidyl-prolyl cis-trans isomerase n=1 Tax=Pseudidiomarina gelatinasegens TaxID=2487740 RepID=A0A443Z6Z6_9GAMM|nr:peptidylprolyl isomerase [Pseudidiomarina gelatinasegens]RWU12697.1 peptidyl-prolyl cis-trans isomerase [Pseudidiomarina gelatinasegens]
MRYLVFALALLLSGVSAAQQIQPDNLFPKVKFITTEGDIVVELNRAKAPITVENFLTYVQAGSYNNTIFHRIIPGFVVQGGGYTEEFEAKTMFDPIFNESGNGMLNNYGTIAMARVSDPHSATRQFYFNLNDNESLNPSSKGWGYAVFGWVVSGEDVMEKLASVETEFYHEQTGWPNVPKQPPVLKKIEVVPQQ